MSSAAKERLTRAMRDKRVVISDRANISSTRDERLNADAKYVALHRVKPNSNQPRKHFDAEALDELAASVRQDGVLQPIVVRPTEDAYQIIMGERRYRAALLAGLEEVPVIVRGMDDEEAFVAALVENLQRANLEPADEAEAYQGLLGRGHSARTIAERLGISHSRISRAVRVFEDELLSTAVSDGLVSKSQAQELLTVQDPVTRPRLVQFIAGRRKEGRPLSTEEFRAELKAVKASVETESLGSTGGVETAGGVSHTTTDADPGGVTHTTYTRATPGSEGPVGDGAHVKLPSALEQRTADVEAALEHYRAIHALLEVRPILAWDAPIAGLRSATEALADKVSGRPHADIRLSTKDRCAIAHKIRLELESYDSVLDGAEQDPETIVELEAALTVLERRLGRRPARS